MRRGDRFDQLRVIGEVGVDRLGPAKKASVKHRTAKIPVKCKECGFETDIHLTAARYYPSGFICRKCREAGERELETAMANIAARKRRIREKRT